jgi:hypothetical protein
MLTGYAHIPLRQPPPEIDRDPALRKRLRRWWSWNTSK